MENIIMHIDVNNAFLSWTAVDLLEKGYKKDIRNEESIIAGDEKKRSGIVLAKSPVAKAKGVITAETIQSAKRKCPNLKIYKPNYEMYKKRSNELFKLLLNYTPDIEIASIDECYLDYSKVKYLYKNHEEFARKIQKEINQKLKITINIGIANNKLCAKMASDFSKPNKIHTLYEHEIKEKLYPLPIEKLYGVGKKTTEKLKLLGINKIGELATKNESQIKRTFKNQAKHLIEIANGIDDSIVSSEIYSPKGISNEITFEKDIDNIQDLNKKLLELSEVLSYRVRKENKYAKVICVILKDKYFKRYSHQKKLKNPISSYSEIYKYSKEILSEFYNNEKIRLIGIRLDDLKDERIYQTSLFEENKNNNEELDKIMDKINEKYGKKIITRASNIKKQNKYRQS